MGNIQQYCACDCGGNSSKLRSSFLDTDNPMNMASYKQQYELDAKFNWPHAQYQALLKAGSRSMIFNQKDVAGGASVVDVRNKRRLNELSQSQRMGVASSVLDDSDSGSEDGLLDASEFLQQLDELQKSSPPDRVFDHYQ